MALRKFSGLFYHSPSNRWRACVRTAPGRYLNLGYFYTRERARKQLDRYHGSGGSLPSPTPRA